MKITEKNKMFWPQLWVTKGGDGDKLFAIVWDSPNETNENIWVAEYELVSVKRHVVTHEFKE